MAITRLTLCVPGFTTVKIQSIELLVGQNATVPLVLGIATLTENVIVTGDSPLVDTASTQVSGNVNRQQMETLPLQGRNWLELSKLVKGITANEIGNTPGVADDMFQLNLDGQDTQKTSARASPRSSAAIRVADSRCDNLFDITGRSSGKVHAISRLHNPGPAAS